MTDQSPTPETGANHSRAGVVYAVAGVVYAVLAALSAALLLFLPVLLLGYTLSVLATVARGDGVAWTSVAGMNYVFIGIPALLATALLVIPAALLRAAGPRIGTRRAIRWVGGLLVAWHVGVGLIWLREASPSFTLTLVGDDIWYAVAFGLAAIVIVTAEILAERRAVRAMIVVGGAVTVALVALGVTLVAVWGSPTRIPTGAQVVRIILADSEVRLDPATVHEGDVYFVIEGPDARPDQAGFDFVGGGGEPCESCVGPLPMNEQTAAGLAEGDFQGTGHYGGWYGDSPVKYTLLAGSYAFIIGDAPDVAPRSVAVLEVTP